MKNQGFTLVELMIVISIVGFLAAAAIPTYSSYLERSKVTEAFAFTAQVTKLINEYYAYHGYFPADNQALQLPPADQLTGRYIQTLQVEKGAIHITFSEGTSLNGILSFQPSRLPVYPPPANLTWICGYAQPITGMVVVGDNKTTLPQQLLPEACQSI